MIKISQINNQSMITPLSKTNLLQQFNPQMRNQEPDTVSSENNNVSFRGWFIKSQMASPGNACSKAALDTLEQVNQYALHELSADKLEKLKAEVLKRANSMGINNFSLVKNEHFKANYATQAIDKLMNHKIFKEGNIKDKLGTIYSLLLTHSPDCEKRMSECMLEFIDILTAKENKRILKNKTIQNNLSYIIMTPANKETVATKKQFMEYLTKHPAIRDNKTVQDNLYNMIVHVYKNTIDSKIQFMEYLTEHPEVMDKNIDLGKYIELIKPQNYNMLIHEVGKSKPHYNPSEALKNFSVC